MNDSIWAVVAGVAKAYNLSLDYVLYNMSYANMILYGAVLPSYGRDKGKRQDVIKVDDPRNKDKVKAIFASFD